MNIDLSKFDLEAAAVHPYLAIFPKKKTFEVYEGAFGKRYQYFAIPVNSETEKMCQEYYNRYFVQNEFRHNYYEDGEAFLAYAKGDKSVSFITGPKAYLKYWNSLTKEDKLSTHFNVIPQFAALKEWYRLRLENVVERKRAKFTDADIRDAFVKQWTNSLLSEMEVYLQAPIPPVKFSLLSMSHARELHQFYNWVESKRPGKGASESKDSLVGRLWFWIRKDLWVVTIIGGIIVLVLGTYILKKLHLIP